MVERLSVFQRMLTVLSKFPGLGFLANTEQQVRQYEENVRAPIAAAGEVRGDIEDVQSMGQEVALGSSSESDDEESSDDSQANDSTSSRSPDRRQAATGGAPSDSSAHAGTMMPDQYDTRTSSDRPSSGSRRAPQSEPTYDGTLMPHTPAYQGAGESPAPAARHETIEPTGHYDTARALLQDQPPLVAPRMSAEKLERLEYVCRLLRQARQPMCPINGVLVMLPLPTIQAGPREVEELKQAARGDLQTLQNSLSLRAPTTALVTGMEYESGFRELVRRVGRDKAAVQRFGQRYDVRNRATDEELESLSIHACGAFEDWIYTLFREDEALTRPGNTKLYSLLCSVRGTLTGQLGEVLADGFGHDDGSTRGEEPFLFSGCYFAATGRSEDRQAFVRGVFEKLIGEQDSVEWTREGVQREQRHRTFSAIGFAASGVLALSLLVMMLMNWFS